MFTLSHDAGVACAGQADGPDRLSRFRPGRARNAGDGNGYVAGQALARALRHMASNLRANYAEFIDNRLRHIEDI